MIQLLPVHLINPGTDLVMCTKMRKNANYTDEPLHMTCQKCIVHYNRNVEWWAGTDTVALKLSTGHNL